MKKEVGVIEPDSYKADINMILKPVLTTENTIGTFDIWWIRGLPPLIAKNKAKDY